MQRACLVVWATLGLAAAGCVVPHPPADTVGKESPAGTENPPLRAAAEAAHKRIGTALNGAAG